MIYLFDAVTINLLGAGIAMNIVDILASGLLIIGTVKVSHFKKKILYRKENLNYGCLIRFNERTLSKNNGKILFFLNWIIFYLAKLFSKEFKVIEYKK